MIEIREIKDRRDLRKFASFPVKLYKGCPYYVPSLRGDEKDTFNAKKNPNLKNNLIKGFLCYKDGNLVGRIAGMINKKDNELTGKKMVRFSRFEAIDDIEVFKALLSAVEQFGYDNGMEIIHGPWGFNDTDREGMLTFGFDQRATYAENYYYPYFYKNMEKLGYLAESKWIEYKFTIPEKPQERVVDFVEKIKGRLNVRDLTDTMSVKKIIKEYGHKLYDTVNEAYGHLDGYVPIVGEAVDNVLAQFGTICNARYLSIMVDDNDEVVAFAVCLPSICDALIKSRGKLFPFGFIRVLRSIKKPKQLEMALIGVKSAYKNSGVNYIMIEKILRNIIEDKIELLESNSMLEHNYSIQAQWKFAESEIHKKRQTYTKEISGLVS